MITSEQRYNILSLVESYADAVSTAQSLWDENANLTEDERKEIDSVKDQLESYLNSLVQS